jgi:hypothetical protein
MADANAAPVRYWRPTFQIAGPFTAQQLTELAFAIARMVEAMGGEMGGAFIETDAAFQELESSHVPA